MVCLPPSNTRHHQGSRRPFTCASLMINGPAWQEAVDLAKAHPSLCLGLHLALIQGRGVLAHHRIPNLVEAQGNFRQNPVAAGFTYFFPLRPAGNQAELTGPGGKNAASGVAAPVSQRPPGCPPASGRLAPVRQLAIDLGHSRGASGQGKSKVTLSLNSTALLQNCPLLHLCLAVPPGCENPGDLKNQ